MSIWDDSESKFQSPVAMSAKSQLPPILSGQCSRSVVGVDWFDSLENLESAGPTAKPWFGICQWRRNSQGSDYSTA